MGTDTRVVPNLPGIWVGRTKPTRDLGTGTRVVPNIPAGTRVEYPPSGTRVLPASSRVLCLSSRILYPRYEMYMNQYRLSRFSVPLPPFRARFPQRRSTCARCFLAFSARGAGLAVEFGCRIFAAVLVEVSWLHVVSQPVHEGVLTGPFLLKSAGTLDDLMASITACGTRTPLQSLRRRS